MYDFFTSAFSAPPKVDPIRQASFDRYAKVEIDRTRFDEVFAKRGIPASAIDTLFRSMDINGDGRVSQADVQRVLHLYGQKQEPTVTKTENESVKTPQAADNDISREEKNRKMNSTPLDSDTVEKLIEQLEQKAGTYNRFGLRHISAIGAFINTLA
ncbi:MAG: hypothetical protein KA247_03930 [Bacteroidetes bacterium]|nr:hypothetical protein [Bacteroidota bacterium]